MDERRSSARASSGRVGGGGGTRSNTMISPGSPASTSSRRTPLPGAATQPRGQQDQLGAMVTKGLGAGANPEIGRQAALEDRESCSPRSKARTWSRYRRNGPRHRNGRGPIIADLARSVGALTVAW